MTAIRTKVDVYSTLDKPTEPDVTAVDGIMMHGCRKVREKNGIGYILAHNMKFGCSELSKHKGRWVLVDVSDYLAVTAKVGYSYPHETDNIQYSGVRCDALSECDLDVSRTQEMPRITKNGVF